MSTENFITVNIPVSFESQGPYNESLMIDRILTKLNTPCRALDSNYQKYYFDNGFHCECITRDEQALGSSLKQISNEIDSAFQEEARLLKAINNGHLGYDVGTPYVIPNPTSDLSYT